MFLLLKVWFSYGFFGNEEIGQKSIVARPRTCWRKTTENSRRKWVSHPWSSQSALNWTWQSSLLLDAMLANLLPSQVPNPGYHPSPLPSHPTIPSQSQHSPTELPSHQPSSSALPPLFSSSHSFGPRLDRQDTNIPISLHNYSNHPTPNHFYLSSSSYDGRDGTSHHYSGSSSRSRGLQSDVGQRG